MIPDDESMMAFPFVKVIFEIGHEASVRNKRTPEGFTHDWELFVRGADNTDIHYFVDKVVFHLHETFPNPKRVIKEPPYVVKESGYAGFPLPIDIYVKNNKDEPRKIRFNYELCLNDRGTPPISKVTRETYVFNPSEDFRRKLIKGGGTSVLSHDGTEAKNSNSSSAISKQKSITNTNRLPSPPPKKNKKEDIKLNNTFATLFGSPIQPSKLPLTTSKSTSQKLSSSDKSQVKIKSSPHNKEDKKDKDKERDKEKKKLKELSIDKVKKDKDKKEKTKESSEKSKSFKQSSSKPEKKESTHHEKIKEKSNDSKLEKKEFKDKSKREDKVKEKNKDKSHKEEKSYHETKTIKQDIKTEFNDQEKKKHKSSPESIKIKSDKKIEKSEKSSKPHKSHKEHKKRDKRDKEEKLIKKEEKSSFVEQEPSYKHLDIPQTTTLIEEFPKVKEEILESLPPPKANSSRVHEPELESEEEFLSEDSEPPYQPPEPPKLKEPEPPKKKLSPENNFIKKKKRKKKERDTEETKPKTSRLEISEHVQETCSDISRSPSPSHTNNKFTDEYINSLKHLQHKIMMLEDEDLQRVVTVIAETGHYEITTKTFDFDLCALNETTVKIGCHEHE